jgi:glycosyltransferase involved in cell wall biosynthesis
MKILILTQYFPPEVGAPQNRLFELAVRLQKQGADITVLTAMPNYPQMKIHEAYKGRFYAHENMQGLDVHRSWIYVTTGKGIAKRLLNYFSFVFTSFWIGLFKIKRHDYILCESPPLFLGITAYLLKVIKRSQLIFNVSDLWPESAEKLGLVTNRTMLKWATKLEEFLYRKSAIVTGQTQGIVRNIQERFPSKTLYWLPNGVDLTLFDSGKVSSDWRQKNGLDENDFLLLYAGIIGHAQGLEVIVNAAARLQNERAIKFILLGSGPVKEELIALKEKLGLHNVLFLDAVGKSEMPAITAAIDVAVIPLKKLDLFKGAIPSKIFENLAMKKPILLGVEGEAKELFIDRGGAGLCFEPENDEDLASKVQLVYNDRKALATMGQNGFEYVKDNFTRDLIAHRFWIFLKNEHLKMAGA